MKRLTPKKPNIRPKKISVITKPKNAIKELEKSRKKQVGKSKHLKSEQKNLLADKQQSDITTKTESANE